ALFLLAPAAGGDQDGRGERGQRGEPLGTAGDGSDLRVHWVFSLLKSIPRAMRSAARARVFWYCAAVRPSSALRRPSSAERRSVTLPAPARKSLPISS